MKRTGDATLNEFIIGVTLAVIVLTYIRLKSMKKSFSGATSNVTGSPTAPPTGYGIGFDYSGVASIVHTPPADLVMSTHDGWKRTETKHHATGDDTTDDHRTGRRLRFGGRSTLAANHRNGVLVGTT